MRVLISSKALFSFLALLSILCGYFVLKRSSYVISYELEVFFLALTGTYLMTDKIISGYKDIVLKVSIDHSILIYKERYLWDGYQ